jgi:hypothetical protein
MKVIAINDAPIPENKYYSAGIYLDRAYYKGDIFECFDFKTDTSFLIIWHNKLEAEMEVNINNFMTLEDWRNSRLNKILNIKE